MNSSQNPILDAISILKKLPPEQQFRGENLNLLFNPRSAERILQFAEFVAGDVRIL